MPDSFQLDATGTVAFDAVGPSSAGASSSAATTVSWTHTVVGTGSALLVAIGVGANPDTGFTVSVRMDPAGANTAMTSLGSLIHSNNATSGFIALFGLPNVSSGAHVVTGTAAGGTPATLEGGSLSYTGAHPTAAFGSQFSGFGNTNAPTVTVTGSASSSRVAGSAVSAANFSAMPSGTSRWIVNTAGTTNAKSQAGGDAASGALTWTTSTDWWAAAAVEILAAPAVTTDRYLLEDGSGVLLMEEAVLTTSVMRRVGKRVY